MNTNRLTEDAELAVHIPVGAVELQGDLSLPPDATGVVLFAHGSGSGRRSPRNRHVAAVLRSAGFATLLADLLTEEEELAEARTAHLRFNIEMLAHRLAAIIDWLGGWPAVRTLPVGLFGASTGGGAALVTATLRPDRVQAVVSRGGRPDLARDALPAVQCPVLLIVGSCDDVVLQLNEGALKRLGSREKELTVIPGASHLFEEPGTLDAVARHAANWFSKYLYPSRAALWPE